jgi:hypothetical protein
MFSRNKPVLAPASVSLGQLPSESEKKGKSMPFKTKILIAIAIAGFASWAGIVAYRPDLYLADFLTFSKAMAVGTIGLALREMPSGN